MAYLEASEYVAFGLSADTADYLVEAASAMVDAYCRRSSLLSTSYTERVRLDGMRMTARLTYGPPLELTGLRARYGCSRNTQTSELLGYALAFQPRGEWVELDPLSASLDAVSREIQLPSNLLGFTYSEAEVTYTAGTVEIPKPVKVACAQIVKNGLATSGLNVKSSRMDVLQMEYFSDSLLDSQVRMLLRPYVAERLG